MSDIIYVLTDINPYTSEIYRLGPIFANRHAALNWLRDNAENSLGRWEIVEKQLVTTFHTTECCLQNGDCICKVDFGEIWV